MKHSLMKLLKFVYVGLSTVVIVPFCGATSNNEDFVASSSSAHITPKGRSVVVGPSTVPSTAEVSSTRAVEDNAPLQGQSAQDLRYLRYDSDSEEESNYGQIYEHKSQKWEEDLKERLSLFKGKKVVVLYRGVHFHPISFSEEERREAPKRNHAGQSLLAPEILERIDRTRKEIKNLGSKLTVNKGKSRAIAERDLLQQRFANNYGGAIQEMKEGTGTRSQGGFITLYRSPTAPVLENIPFVSCTYSPLHAIKYAYGIKGHGNVGAHILQPLQPNYQLDGRPQYPYLGILYAIILEEKDLSLLHPYSIQDNHDEGNIHVNTHFSNNIYSEEEVSIPSAVPSRNVVYGRPVRVPSFSNEYDGYHTAKYGFSKKRYKSGRLLILSDPKKLIEEHLNPKKSKETKEYNNSLNRSLPRLIGNELQRIEAIIGKINAQGEWVSIGERIGPAGGTRSQDVSGIAHPSTVAPVVASTSAGVTVATVFSNPQPSSAASPAIREVQLPSVEINCHGNANWLSNKQDSEKVQAIIEKVRAHQAEPGNGGTLILTNVKKTLKNELERNLRNSGITGVIIKLYGS